jgi:antitoxin StbD
MNTLYSSFTASVSELKKNPTALLKESAGEAIAILNHNVPSAYLIPAATYEVMMEALEDSYLMEMVKNRLHEKEEGVEVSLDDL